MDGAEGDGSGGGGGQWSRHPCSSSHQELESMPPFLESGVTFYLALTHRLWPSDGITPEPGSQESMSFCSHSVAILPPQWWS